MSRLRTSLIVLAVLVLSGATVAFAVPGRAERGSGAHQPYAGDAGNGHEGKRGRLASARLINASAERVGRVRMRERRRDGVVVLHARVPELPPGFHGPLPPPCFPFCD